MEAYWSCGLCSKIATVTKSGKMTAKGSGTCYIYVFAHNGVSKSVKVTVK